MQADSSYVTVVKLTQLYNAEHILGKTSEDWRTDQSLALENISAVLWQISVYHYMKSASWFVSLTSY